VEEKYAEEVTPRMETNFQLFYGEICKEAAGVRFQ
jgi:hypothetical protein